MNIEKISQKEVKTFFQELSEFCENQQSSNFFTFENLNINRLSFSETFRAIVSHDFSNSVLSDLIISKMEGLERYSPPAASFLPFFTSEMSKIKRSISIEEIEASNPDLKDIKEILEFCFKHASFINEEIANKIFENNGFISDFQIKQSLVNQNSVIFSSGTNIKCNNFSGFFESCNSREFIDSNIIIYDGFIEKVSELNYVLTKSNEDKSKFLIICAGASMDVLNTCAVNIESKKASVFIAIPEADFWKNEIFELKSSIPVYGNETGKLLNMIEEDTACNCVATQTGLYIKDINSNSITKANTEIYLRKESWGSRGVLVDQLNYLKSVLQQVATCGVLKKESLQSIEFDFESALGRDFNCLPAFPVVRAIKESEKLCSQIFNISHILRLEN